MRKFFKTVYQIEVLSEEPLPDKMSLAQVEYEITDGHYSGSISITETKLLTAKEAAEALIAQVFARSPELQGDCAANLWKDYYPEWEDFVDNFT